MFDEHMLKSLYRISGMEYTDSEFNDMSKNIKGLIEIADKILDFPEDCHCYTADIKTTDELRQDTVQDGSGYEEIFKNTSRFQDRCFYVPSVINSEVDGEA